MIKSSTESNDLCNFSLSLFYMYKENNGKGQNFISRFIHISDKFGDEETDIFDFLPVSPPILVNTISQQWYELQISNSLLRSAVELAGYTKFLVQIRKSVRPFISLEQKNFLLRRYIQDGITLNSRGLIAILVRLDSQLGMFQNPVLIYR